MILSQIIDGNEFSYAHKTRSVFEWENRLNKWNVETLVKHSYKSSA